MIYFISFLLPFIGPLFVGRIGFSILSLIVVVITAGVLWPLMSIISLFVVSQAYNDKRQKKLIKFLKQ